MTLYEYTGWKTKNELRPHYSKGEKTMTRNDMTKFFDAIHGRNTTASIKVTKDHFSDAVEFPVRLDLITTGIDGVNIECTVLDNSVTKYSDYYARKDIKVTKEVLNSVYGVSAFKKDDIVAAYGAFKKPDYDKSLLIKKVIFNDPATIIFWQDGTKTVVKTQNGEVFDPEKGMAMAIAKKAMGNQGNYFNLIKEHVDEYRKRFSIEMNADALTFLKDGKPVYRVDGDGMGPAKEEEKKEEQPWRLWCIDRHNPIVSKGVYNKTYKRKCDAVRVANKLTAETGFEYIVSRTNPWDGES